MPIVELTIQSGCRDEDIAACMKAITASIAGNLENTLPRMVRVTVTEVEQKYILQGSAHPQGAAPTVMFQLGPGRSDEMIEKTLQEIVQAIHTHLGAPEDEIRVYLNMITGDSFSIGGKVKDFGKQP